MRAPPFRWTWREKRCIGAPTCRPMRGRTPRFRAGWRPGSWRWLVGAGPRLPEAGWSTRHAGTACWYARRQALLATWHPALRASAGGSSAGRSTTRPHGAPCSTRLTTASSGGSPHWRGRRRPTRRRARLPTSPGCASRGRPPRRRPSPARANASSGQACARSRASRPPARRTCQPWRGGWLRSRPQAPSRPSWWRACCVPTTPRATPRPWPTRPPSPRRAWPPLQAPASPWRATTTAWQRRVSRPSPGCPKRSAAAA